MKLRIITFITGITFIILNPELALAATLSLSPASGTFNKGCNFSLNIELDAAGAQTDGTDAILKYDPTRVSAISITNGTIYPDYPGNSIDTQTGKINVSGLASPDKAFSSKGTLATVNFKVSQTAPVGDTQVNFDFDPNNKAKTTDSNVVERGTIIDVLSSVTDGTYTIGSGACGSSSSSQTSGTTRLTSGSGSTGTSTTGSLGSLTSGGTEQGTQGAQLKELSPGGKAPGLTGPTLVLVISGTVLILLGIVGLALL